MIALIWVGVFYAVCLDPDRGARRVSKTLVMSLFGWSFKKVAAAVTKDSSVKEGLNESNPVTDKVGADLNPASSGDGGGSKEPIKEVVQLDKDQLAALAELEDCLFCEPSY